MSAQEFTQKEREAEVIKTLDSDADIKVCVFRIPATYFVTTMPYPQGKHSMEKRFESETEAMEFAEKLNNFYKKYGNKR